MCVEEIFCSGSHYDFGGGLAMDLKECVHSADMRIMEPDGLALEYQGDYGTPRRNLNVADLVNNPIANSECRVLGLGLSEEFWNRRLVYFGSLFQDLPDSPVVVEDIVQHLPNVLLPLRVFALL